MTNCCIAIWSTLTAPAARRGTSPTPEASSSSAGKAVRVRLKEGVAGVPLSHLIACFALSEVMERKNTRSLSYMGDGTT